MLPRDTSKSRRMAAPLFTPAGVAAVVLTILSAPALFSAVGQNSSSPKLAAAMTAERAGDYASAATYYRQFLEEAQAQHAQADSLTGVRVELAKDYFFLRRYEESLGVLAPALGQSAGERSQVRAQVALVAGLDELELNRLAPAIQQLQKAVKLDPQSGTARLAMGDALARSNRLEGAAREYREQLARTPSVADAWYKLGVVYSHLSDKTAQDAARRDPTDNVVGQLFAERLLEKGDSAAALPSLVNLLRASPKQPDLRADLGTALLDLGYARPAAQQFHAELSQDPESPKALLGIAETDALAGDWETVFNSLIHLARFHPRQLRQELEVPPPKPLRDAWQQRRLKVPAGWADTSVGKLWVTWLTDSGADVQFVASPHADCAHSGTSTQKPGTWLTEACYQKLRSALENHELSDHALPAKLAETDFRLGDYERARAEAEMLAQRQPSSGWAAYWLSRSYEALAYQCFRRLSLLSSKSTRVQQMLAQLDASRFRWSRAEEEYQSAIRLAPNLPDLHLGLGTVYWQAGNWLQAEAELESTLKLDPASPVASYELGDCYIEQHQWRAAIPHLRRAIADPSVSYRARLDLAHAEEESGNTGRALQDLLAVANDDRDGVLHYRLALLYRKAGDTGRAGQALARSQDLRRSLAQAVQQHIQQAEQDLRILQVSSQPTQP